MVKSFFQVDADPHEVFFEVVEPEIRRRGGWETLQPEVSLSPEEIYLEFVYDWDKVRYELGATPLDNAVEKADTVRLVPKRCSDHPNPIYARFVSVAGWLQVTMGNRPIMLPCEKLAKTLSSSPMTISRCRTLALKDGFLKIVREHSFSSHRATEFRFDVTRFACLTKKAQGGTVEACGRSTGMKLGFTVPRGGGALFCRRCRDSAESFPSLCSIRCESLEGRITRRPWNCIRGMIRI